MLLSGCKSISKDWSFPKMHPIAIVEGFSPTQRGKGANPMRKKRMNLRLQIKELARLLDATSDTIIN